MALSIEDKIQSNCFIWHWNEYPQERGMLFAVPNGGLRDPITANKLKATGVVKGTSDMILVTQQVIFIEIKIHNGVQSEDQIDFQIKVQDRGHIYVIIRSFEDFKHFIKAIYE